MKGEKSCCENNEAFFVVLNALKEQTANETRQLIQLGLNKQNDDA